MVNVSVAVTITADINVSIKITFTGTVTFKQTKKALPPRKGRKDRGTTLIRIDVQ